MQTDPLCVGVAPDGMQLYVRVDDNANPSKLQVSIQDVDAEEAPVATVEVSREAKFRMSVADEDTPGDDNTEGNEIHATIPIGARRVEITFKFF